MKIDNPAIDLQDDPSCVSVDATSFSRLLADIKAIIKEARSAAYAGINAVQIDHVVFPDSEIWHTRVPNLSWSHFRLIMRVADPTAREWYINEASNEHWGVRITYQDVGQMDMYVRMYDELVKQPDDNPTIGIVLCADTDPDIARYSILKGNERLFATKYKLNLPTPEELTEEVARQRATLMMQFSEEGDGK